MSYTPATSFSRRGDYHFAVEPYLAEILEKAPVMPADVQWHFIGHIQSNKAKSLVQGVPSLFMVETVDSVKLADKLNNAVGDAARQGRAHEFWGGRGAGDGA